MNDFEIDASAPKGVSRRTVVKGAAWAVPVIAVASAAPAFAASPERRPGDHCYAGAYAGNAFRFYVNQPTNVNDTITISGPAAQNGAAGDNGTTQIPVGCGVTVEFVSRSGTYADGSVVVVYKVTAVNPAVNQPFVIIEGNNTSGNPGRDLYIQQGATEWTAYSNSRNCNALGWAGCPVALTPAVGG